MKKAKFFVATTVATAALFAAVPMDAANAGSMWVRNPLNTIANFDYHIYRETGSTVYSADIWGDNTINDFYLNLSGFPTTSTVKFKGYVSNDSPCSDSSGNYGTAYTGDRYFVDVYVQHAGDTTAGYVGTILYQHVDPFAYRYAHNTTYSPTTTSVNGYGVVQVNLGRMWTNGGTTVYKKGTSSPCWTGKHIHSYAAIKPNMGVGYSTGVKESVTENGVVKTDYVYSNIPYNQSIYTFSTNW